MTPEEMDCWIKNHEQAKADAKELRMRREYRSIEDYEPVGTFSTWEQAVREGLPFSTWDIAVAEGLVK